jgi:hypothetical protein
MVIFFSGAEAPLWKCNLRKSTGWLSAFDYSDRERSCGTPAVELIFLHRRSKCSALETQLAGGDSLALDFRAKPEDLRRK